MYKKKGDLNHTAWLFLSLNAEYFLPKGSFLLSFFFFFGAGHILTQGTVLYGS